jgi:hypothetical protein
MKPTLSTNCIKCKRVIDEDTSVIYRIDGSYMRMQDVINLYPEFRKLNFNADNQYDALICYTCYAKILGVDITKGRIDMFDDEESCCVCGRNIIAPSGEELAGASFQIPKTTDNMSIYPELKSFKGKNYPFFNEETILVKVCHICTMKAFGLFDLVKQNKPIYIIINP